MRHKSSQESGNGGRKMDDGLEDLFRALYLGRFIQTLWNAFDPRNRKNGWRLKSKLWMPWFFDMRDLGDDPETFYSVCGEMVCMISQYEDIDNLLAVEMAGIPLVGGVSSHLVSIGTPRRFAYTRPLKTKVRNPNDLMTVLEQSNVDDYGQKDLIEGRMRDGDRFAIFDDMATTLDSKIIARAILLYQAEERGIDLTCDTVFYFLDRGKESKKTGLNFANYPNKDLWPAPLRVDFVISFDKHLPVLEEVMTPNEFQAIIDHQKDPKRFGEDEEWRRSLFKMAEKEAH